MWGMRKPTLYLLIGYPGAGKTTVAQMVAKETGAIHLWADLERHKMFPQPTHSLEESTELYERLNEAAEYLLAQGKSVVFDTNFNFYADRQKLRQIAGRHGAETVVIWIATPVDVARQRAVGTHIQRNGYPMTMSAEQFNSIVAKLEPPTKHEKVIKIDGVEFDEPSVLALLKQ